ncbi:MAG: hypothetical protein WD844_09160 [Thermoleophilaceae bacterium]
MGVALAALRCHATNAESLRGAEAFARALGERLGTEVRMIGDPPPAIGQPEFEDDGLEELVAAVAHHSEVVGVEATAFDDADPETVLPAVQALITRGAHVPG